MTKILKFVILNTEENHMKIENLGSFQQGVLLDWFLYHMPMEQRYLLMKEYPALYNQLAGTDILKVVRVSDGMVI